MNPSKRPGRAVAIVILSFFVAAAWAVWPAPVRKLPEAVEKSVRKVFPNARIAEFEREQRVVQLIEVGVT